MTKRVALKVLLVGWLDDPAPDEHWHKCDCGKQWKHRTSRLGCNFEEAHTCASCGEDCTRVFVRA